LTLNIKIGSEFENTCLRIVLMGARGQGNVDLVVIRHGSANSATQYVWHTFCAPFVAIFGQNAISGIKRDKKSTRVKKMKKLANIVVTKTREFIPGETMVHHLPEIAAVNPPFSPMFRKRGSLFQTRQ